MVYLLQGPTLITILFHFGTVHLSLNLTCLRSRWHSYYSTTMSTKPHWSEYEKKRREWTTTHNHSKSGMRTTTSESHSKVDQLSLTKVKIEGNMIHFYVLSEPTRFTNQSSWHILGSKQINIFETNFWVTHEPLCLTRPSTKNSLVPSSFVLNAVTKIQSFQKRWLVEWIRSRRAVMSNVFRLLLFRLSRPMVRCTPQIWKTN